MRDIINIFFSKLEYLIHGNRVNIFKTIYLNFRSLPFSLAVKFPIYVYGKCNFLSLQGTIEINGIIKRGIIKLGEPALRNRGELLLIENRGTILFGENVTIRGGLRLSTSKDSVISFGNNCFISDNATIFCTRRIFLGEGMRFANNVVVMDTDFHFLLNTETGTIQNNKKGIEIGRYNWIGSFTTIKKGTCTPDYTIVVGPYTTIGKDYRDIIEPYSIIGGSPAKLIKTGFLRVFKESSEKLISNHYLLSNSVFEHDLNDMESFCLY
jgi:acetyltransferase-like isoleucine patch superfamily enzyme